MYYEATLKPENVETLDPEVEKLRGEKIILIKGWRAENGPYLGQQCYITGPYFGWIPECELKDMKQISYSEWKNKKISLEKSEGFKKSLDRKNHSKGYPS